MVLLSSLTMLRETGKGAAGPRGRFVYMWKDEARGRLKPRLGAAPAATKPAGAG
jgi:hypothetical protein